MAGRPVTTVISWRDFRIQLGLRIGGLFVGLLALSWGLIEGTGTALLILIFLFTAFQFISVVRYINRTNRELESFLAGLRFGDFQQTYTIAHLGPSFRSLENMLKITVEKFKQLRSDKERQAIYYQALVQHIPIPLFTLSSDHRINVLNQATRRTFNVADLTHADDLIRFGAGFQRDVLQVKPGEALLSTLELPGGPAHFIVTATQLTTGGSVSRLISLQNVQSQIDATELATWQNLLRVTSHEILNSLAPVSSCAQTAKSLIDDAISSQVSDPGLLEDLQDIGESIDTVLRRSEGLARFIQSYRQLSRLPPPKKEKIEVDRYFHRLKSLVQGELARKNIALQLEPQSAAISLAADEDMLDQALINLVRNASNALEGRPNAKITLVAYTDDQQRTVLEVQDNGPGIADDIAAQIFEPFFTTREKGTGVGLALVRYIMLSHGGSVSFRLNPPDGSVFRLVF